MAGAKRKGVHLEEEHENEERWLVSFADMMTLLFALFMVLFSISSVNTSKFEELQKSLHDAFSGAILSGGKSMLNSGSSDVGEPEVLVGRASAAALTPMTALNNASAQEPAEAAKQAAQEQQSFKRSSAGSTTLPRRPGWRARSTSPCAAAGWSSSC